MKAYEMENIMFPDCYVNCDAAHFMGVGECEFVCPWKFTDEGEPIGIKDLGRHNLMKGEAP